MVNPWTHILKNQFDIWFFKELTIFHTFLLDENVLKNYYIQTILFSEHFINK